MENGFGDYNLTICDQNMLFNCFKFKMAPKIRTKWPSKYRICTKWTICVIKIV